MNANKPYIIGLTGGIGCGKSEAAEYLRSLGAVHVDADAISRALTTGDPETLNQIREQFGDGVFASNGALDRAALAGIVFESEPHRRALEKILHPKIQSRVWSEIERAGADGARVVVLDVPLLFETGMDALCDETWLISLDRATQAERLMARDGMTREQAEARIDSQMPLEEKERRATVVIDNRRSVEKLNSEVGSLYQALKKRIERMENE